MDIPDLTVPDIGDTGSTPPLPAHIPHDPPPLRSSSPPLPPRKHALGLPPTYTAHLRALLHQWLTQQTTSASLPPTADHSNSPAPLWDDHKVQAIEKAIWTGAIIPGDKADGRKRLLQLDWADWASGAARRKRLWRDTHPHSPADSMDRPANEALKGKRRPQSIHTEDGSRGTLAAPPTGLSTLSTSSTPQRIPSRPPSVASTERTWRGDGTRSPLGVSPSINEGDGQDPEERQHDFHHVLMDLRGFIPLSVQSKDEWEVLADDLPPPHTSERALPGAFPQSGHHRDASPVPEAPPLPPKHPPSGLHITTDDLVKPLFCVHFPASPSGASTSTVHLRRKSSLGYGSNPDSVGSMSGSWWSAGGSGRRWSGIGLGMARDLDEEDVEVDFVEGQFALPTSAAAPMSPKRISRKTSQRRRQRSEVTDSASTAITSADTSDTDGDDDHSSTWSGTQRAGSFVNRHTSWSSFIGGSEDDIPRSQVQEGKVCVVGGTIVIRGVRSDEERQAVQKVLQLVLYTIQAMILELELLDAFRAPRESDPLPVPPKDPLPHRHQASSSMSSPRSSILSRKSSHKDRGERGKGFFQRLGKDTRGMFDGFMGRNKSPERASLALPRTHSLDHPLPQLDALSDFRPDTPTSSVVTGASTPIVNQATDRYIQTLNRLEAILPSPTPGLRVPMPPLLVRVRDEERLRAEKVHQELAEETGGTMNDVIDGLTRRGVQSLVREDPTRTRGRAYRPGGDVRAGLAALASGIEDFGGWIRLQRLELLTCTGIEQQVKDATTNATTLTTTICEKPKVTNFTFWNDNDETIYDVLTSITDEERICPKPGCDAEQEEHTRWWCHNGRKVGMTVRRVEQGMGEIGLDVYVKCGECKRHTEPRLLNDSAGSFSWGKLLELLLYTDVLAPRDLCEHADKPSSLITTIRSPHVVVNLTVRPVMVLDTRLPKLQVGPNVAKRKAGKAGAIGTADGLMKRETRSAAIEAVKTEVEIVIQRVRERCAEVEALLAETASTAGSSTIEKPRGASSDGPTLTDSDKLDVIEKDLEAAAGALATTVSTTPSGQLNSVRQETMAVYRRFETRLDAIHKKGDSKDKSDDGEKSRSGLPEYFGRQVHALPGSAVLVREAEPSSIIAYTLSSVAYFTELTNAARPTEANDSKLEAHDVSGWIIDVKRRDTPRDLLSLRTITKKRSDASLVKSEHRLPLTVAPNQPSLEVSLEQVEGRSQASDRLDDLVKSISKATAQDPVLTLKTRSPSISESDVSGSSLMGTPRLSPGMARRTSDSTRTGVAPPSAFRPTRSVSSTTVPSTPIPSATSPLSGSASGVSTPGSTVTGLDTIISTASKSTGNGSKDGWSSVTSTFTNTLNTFMRLGSDMGSFRMRGGDRSLSSLMGPLSMMSAMDNSLSSSNLDDRPHVQFTYTLPEKLRIECTVYYATAFDSLRRRCAIDRSILDSLARCEPWDAQGGKSKASFFMSGDKRYIVKELVSKWNVSDTQALLEIAPSYFEHLASTHNKAVALAKIVGFFSIKIHDMQTSTKKSMDLVVMENLFYKQTVTQTYDLKGIEGRKVPKTMVEGSTLFDSEWIEGQSKAPILLQPHAKRILQEAIYNDTKYLCSQGIMDYSLLLGLDNQRNELVVGLVDAIGSFNLFKTIESRGKLALTRGGEVTIIPPDQYRERFENALRQYFVACPDKWSKTSRRNHEESLPSVF